MARLENPPVRETKRNTCNGTDFFISFKSTLILPQPRKPPEAIRKGIGRGRLHFLFDPSFVTAAGSHRKLCGSRPEENVNK